MRDAISYAHDLYLKVMTFPGLVQAVSLIQRDAFTAGQRQASAPIHELSEEVDRRLERLAASDHHRARQTQGS